ncbi:UV radiation resistance like protein [Emericellopsis cladophorae]|uniref:Autophagy-related protein 14 n=1 Tax=Emericellopsis cladophorae TaxID=2686198 RepID=A0A9P9Y6Z3_9HYPO|nr:UV radiation resistance like protein [Emericellopsis cladophorae]KAI6784632.1 UV radiation resistance like protein [Emericellopsis cladophorae]
MSTLSEHRRPRLLPHNRKLRHLTSLSLRNLTFTHAHTSTTDDDALPTPRLDTLAEVAHAVQHSRSSENLRASADKASKKAKRPARPRRTSLNLGYGSSQRQKTLEEAVNAIVGDVFFTLHVPGDDEPVYISETRTRSANFNFNGFDLSHVSKTSSRTPIISIHLYARRPKSQEWLFLLAQQVDLRQLNFIGTLLDRRFPPNALVFHLQDGIYSLDFPNRISEPVNKAPKVNTASYNVLMKLSNLEASIEDAIRTQRKITGQIHDILEATPKDESGVSDEGVKLASKYISTQTRTNVSARKRRDDLKHSLRRRRDAMQEGRRIQQDAEADMSSSRSKLELNLDLVRETEVKIHGQRRRICADLASILPIQPIPDTPPLSFSICGISVPNSVYNAATARSINEDALSAGLGLVTMLTRHLQFYLGHPLPYPLFPYGSRSHTVDNISTSIPSSREFPLYLPRGGSATGQWRFEYGWFLLNKDIEALCESQGLRVVDIRHSLPNLKYLLYVMCGGGEEVPERKRGGVRGLWAARMGSHLGTDDQESGRPQRRGSFESVDEQSKLRENGHKSLPFEGERFTLRTKGLRENMSSS